MNKPAKILSGVVASCVILYAAIGFWVLPNIIENVIVKELKTTSPKVEVDCGLIAFNPFTFNTFVSDLKISHYDFAGGELAFSFKSFTLPVTKLGVFSRRIELGSIVLEEPCIDMRKDFRHSASPAKKLEEQAKAAPMQPAKGNAWTWSIDEIRVTKGKASLTDTSMKKDGTLGAHSIEVLVKGLSSALGKTTFTANAVVLDGKCSSSGDFTLSSSQAHVTASASGVDLAKLNPWLRDEADSEIGLGKFNFRSTASMARGKVQATADADFENISVKKHGVPYFGAKSIRVSEIRLTKLDPLEFSIRNLKANLGVQDALLVSDVQGLLGGIVGIFGENKVSKAITKTKIDVVSVSNITYRNGKLRTDGLGTKLLKILNAIWSR